MNRQYLGGPGRVSSEGKTLAYVLCLLALTVLVASCQRSSSMVMSDGKNYIEIKYIGNIKMNDDETAIESISSRRGYLRYRNNKEQMLVEPNDHGGVRYDLYDETGRKLDPSSDEGKKFITRAVHEMIELGFDADGRMDRIERRGGYRALLTATDSVKSDYLRGKYLNRVLRSDSLTPADVAEVLDRARRLLDSDYEKGQLLVKVDDSRLANDSVAQEYLRTAASVHSDYDKARSLKHYLKMPLPAGRYVETLAVIQTLGGDYDKSQTLKEMIEKGIFEGAPFDSLIQVVDHIAGDYDRGNLIRQLVKKDLKEETSWAGLIRATGRISGDYDKGNLLVEIAHRLPRTDSLKAIYLTTAKTLHSDMDYGKVVRAVE